MEAVLKTNMGDIVIRLFEELTPNTVQNFVSLAQKGFYDGVKFHRIISNFMIQSGDPLTKDDDNRRLWGTGGPGYKFDDEITQQNANNAGTISMANAGRNTNGSQFFINLRDNNFLDTKHTVFGNVVSGIDVVNSIGAAPTHPSDVPIEPIVINSVDIIPTTK